MIKLNISKRNDSFWFFVKITQNFLEVFGKQKDYSDLNWKKYTIINKKYFRKFETKENYASAKKIKKNINWEAKYDYLEIVKKLTNKEI